MCGHKEAHSDNARCEEGFLGTALNIQTKSSLKLYCLHAHAWLPLIFDTAAVTLLQAARGLGHKALCVISTSTAETPGQVYKACVMASRYRLADLTCRVSVMAGPDGPQGGFSVAASCTGADVAASRVMLPSGVTARLVFCEHRACLRGLGRVACRHACTWQQHGPPCG